MLKGDLKTGMPRVFWLFVAGFAVLVALMAGLAQLGIDRGTMTALFVGASMIAYAAFGLLSRTEEVDDWFVARREVPALFNGMAKAAGWISGPVFIALAGGLFFSGYGWIAFLVGWSGGLVLMVVLLAPYLRKAGCYTVPEFIGQRYGGDLTRLVAVGVLVVVAFSLMTAQLAVMGTIARQMLGLPHVAGIWLGLAGILFCTIPGGMRSLTWTKVAQYLVLVISLLVPVIWISVEQGYGYLPQIAHGALERAAALTAAGAAPANPEVFAGFRVLSTAPATAGGASEAWRAMTLALCFMAGAAAMPHMLIRLFAASSPGSARSSVAWALLFVMVVALSAPALATLTKLQLLDPELPAALIGQSLERVAALDWVARWSELGGLRIADLNTDGVLQANEIGLRPEAVTLAAPEIAGLPALVSALVAAGGVAAAMSTGQAVLFTLASALGHDVHHALIAPHSAVRRRINGARALLVVIGALAAWVAMQRVTGTLDTLAWASSFAASGLFFPLVLGVWWKRANRAGAIAGMAFGVAAGSIYAYMVHAGGMEPWFGIDALRFGIVGMAVSLVATVVVSLLSPAPDGTTRLLVDEIRRPYGAPVLPRTH